MKKKQLLSNLNPLFKLNLFNTPRVRILMFHAVPEELLDTFNAQITNLYNKYSFIDSHTLHSMLLGRKEKKGTNILISFDDGFESSKTATKEVLDPLGIKAIFFIHPTFIDTYNTSHWKKHVSEKIYNNRLKEDEISNDLKPMCWNDILSLQENGHTIGAHTVNHINLSEIKDINKLEQEVASCQTILSNRLEREIKTFAYPFGNINCINAQSLSLIQKNYEFCYSAVRGNNYYCQSPFTIFRDAIAPTDSPSYVEFIVNGGLDWYYIKERKQLNKLV